MYYMCSHTHTHFHLHLQSPSLSLCLSLFLFLSLSFRRLCFAIFISLILARFCMYKSLSLIANLLCLSVAFHVQVFFLSLSLFPLVCWFGVLFFYFSTFVRNKVLHGKVLLQGQRCFSSRSYCGVYFYMITSGTLCALQ